MDSAKAFFAQAHDVVEQPPQRVATVGHTIYPRVIAEDLGEDVEHELTYSHE